MVLDAIAEEAYEFMMWSRWRTKTLPLLRSALTANARAVAGNLALLVVCTFLTQLCALATFLILTRALGPDGFGRLTFALTLTSYLLLLGCMGIRPVIVREGVQRPGDLDRIIGSHLTITGVTSVLLFLILSVAAWAAPITLPERTLLILLAAGNVAACINLLSLFDAHHRQVRCAAVSLATEFLGLLAVLGLMRAQALDLATVGAVFCGKWLLTTALQYTVYHFSVRRLHIVVSLPDVRRMLHSSLPVLLSGLLTVIPLNSAAFFLRAFGSDADVAVFGLCFQLVSAYLLFAMLAGQVLQPHIAGVYGLYRSFVWKLVLFYGTFLALLWAVAFAGALVLILWFLDPFYRAAILPSALFLCGTMVLSVGNLTNAYLVVFRRERALLPASIASTVVYVCGCLVFVPRYSVTGAAAVLIGAALIQTGMVLRAVRARFIELPFGDALIGDSSRRGRVQE